MNSTDPDIFIDVSSYIGTIETTGLDKWIIIATKSDGMMVNNNYIVYTRDRYRKAWA